MRSRALELERPALVHELEAATTRSALNTAAKRLMQAKAERARISLSASLGHARGVEDTD